MKKKITQKEGIFYQLYEARATDPEQYIPIWKLIGEVFVKEYGLWSFVSYEVSARMSELFKKNPTLFERKQVIGKTGAKYFAYRINIGVTPDDIIDPELKTFWNKVRNSK